MILTFNEVDVTMKAYNGMRADLSRAAIINIACDYIMQHFFASPAFKEEDCLFNVRDAIVDFNAQKIIVETRDDWTI